MEEKMVKMTMQNFYKNTIGHIQHHKDLCKI